MKHIFLGRQMFASLKDGSQVNQVTGPGKTSTWHWQLNSFRSNFTPPAPASLLLQSSSYSFASYSSSFNSCSSSFTPPAPASLHPPASFPEAPSSLLPPASILQLNFFLHLHSTSFSFTPPTQASLPPPASFLPLQPQFLSIFPLHSLQPGGTRSCPWRFSSTFLWIRLSNFIVRLTTLEEIIDLQYINQVGDKSKWNHTLAEVGWWK